MESKLTDAVSDRSEGCNDTDCEKVADLLNAVVDGEVTSEEQAFFNAHIEDCLGCFEGHEKQKLLKGLVSGHLKRIIVPESLALSIKAKIQETV